MSLLRIALGVLTLPVVMEWTRSEAPGASAPSVVQAPR